MKFSYIWGGAALLLVSCSPRPMPLVQGSFETFQPKYETHLLTEQKDSLLALAQLREIQPVQVRNWANYIQDHKSDTLELWVLANLALDLEPLAKDSVKAQFEFLQSYPRSKQPLMSWLQSRWLNQPLASTAMPKTEVLDLKPQLTVTQMDTLKLGDSLVPKMELNAKTCKKHYDSLWLSALELEQAQQFDSSLIAYDRYLGLKDTLSLACLNLSFKDQEERPQIAWFRKGLVLHKTNRDSVLKVWFSDSALKTKSIMNRGSALLLLAKNAQRLGDSVLAKQYWSRMLDDHPVNYYGWLARKQLSETAPRWTTSSFTLQDPKCKIQNFEGLGQALSLSLAFSGRALSRALLKQFSACSHGDSLLAWAQLASYYQDPALSYQLGRRIVESYVPRQNMAKMPKALVSVFFPRPYAEFVRAASEEFKIDSLFIWSIMRQESTFDPIIKSPVGATGLMQLMPATARFLADSLKITEWQDSLLTNPQYNIRLGAYYLSLLLKNHQLKPYAIAHYNAGPAPSKRWETWALNNVDSDLAIEEISYRETRDYVKKVLSNWWNYQAFYRGNQEWISP